MVQKALDYFFQIILFVDGGFLLHQVLLVLEPLLVSCISTYLQIVLCCGAKSTLFYQQNMILLVSKILYLALPFYHVVCMSDFLDQLVSYIGCIIMLFQMYGLHFLMVFKNVTKDSVYHQTLFPYQV